MTDIINDTYKEYFALPDHEKAAVVTINYWRRGDGKATIAIPPDEEDRIRKGFYGPPTYPVQVVDGRTVYVGPPSPAVDTTGIGKFSYYNAPVSNTIPRRSITLGQCAELIELPYPLQEKTEELRALTAPEERKQYKARKFPYVTFSGIFRVRKIQGLLVHSGLMVIDLDQLDDPETIKQELRRDRNLEVAMLFTSPSGEGLKMVVPVDISCHKHADYFEAVSAYLSERYSLTADPSGRDVTRACFLCYDPKIYLNPMYHDWN